MKHTTPNTVSKEEWRSVAGYEGLYWVSNMGRVKSLIGRKNAPKPPEKVRERIMKTFLNGSKYLVLTLCKDGIQTDFIVHRLVAIAFIPNPDNKAEVNHKNGIKTDNRSENLEWNTRGENLTHAFRTGIRKLSGVCKGKTLRLRINP